MIPLNGKDKSCDPVSSNCVIWQGPDIPCIKLCKGDSVSEVIFKLATELCKIIEIVDITTYDLSCFTANSKPESFQDLIQKIINNLCIANGSINLQPLAATGGSKGCPDCIVPIASCFYFSNELGDTVTTLQLKDYAILIGNKVCNILDEISVIQDQINSLDVRVTNLENNPAPSYTPPNITPSCVLPVIPTDPFDVLTALETQFCQLRNATGTPNELFSAIGGSCLPSQPPQSLSNSTPISGWQTIQNLSNAINNIYLLLCDTRQAVRFIQLNCCPSGCEGIDITFQYEYSNPNLTFYFNGTIPAAFTYCGGILPKIKITDDDGNFTYVDIDIISNLNNPSGITVDISTTIVNPVSNLTFELIVCYFNSESNSTCQYNYCGQIDNKATCPNLKTIINSENIEYSFNWIEGSATVTIELYDESGTTLLNSFIYTPMGPETINGVFLGLSPVTNYRIRITIEKNNVLTTCPWLLVTTEPGPILT